MAEVEKKVYTAEEVKKLAPKYKGKPENFDPAKVGTKKTPKQDKGPVQVKEKAVPKPNNMEKAATPTPQKNSPLWAEAIFGIDVSVRELRTEEEVTPTLARLPNIVEETHANMRAENFNIEKQLTKEMLYYYSTAILWARVLDIKSKRGHMLTEAELQYLKLFSDQTLNVPQPIYAFIKALGNIQDKTGKELFLRDLDLPVAVTANRGGYHGAVIDEGNHNLFEELPNLGVIGDVLMAMSNDVLVQPAIGPVPATTVATRNLLGYFGRTRLQKEEIRIYLNSIGISQNNFEEVIPNTRLNMRLVQGVSDYLGKFITFRNEKVNIPSLSSEGDRTLLVRSRPNDENIDVNTTWTNKVVRPTSAAAEGITTYGASYMTGFQLMKEATGNSHQNWCCVTPAANSRWEIPAGWIANRNERRRMPDGFDAERYASIADSQLNRTNACIRRMITAQR